MGPGFVPGPSTSLLSDLGQTTSLLFQVEGNSPSMATPHRDVAKINLEYLEQVGKKHTEHRISFITYS